MRKYVYTVMVMAFFAVGFSASDEENGKSSNIVDSKEVMDKKPSSEKKEESKPKYSPEEQKMAEAGYEAGSLIGLMGSSVDGLSDIINTANYMDAMNNESGETIRKVAAEQYDAEYQVPTNAKEEKLKKIYVDNFIRGLNKTMKALK